MAAENPWNFLSFGFLLFHFFCLRARNCSADMSFSSVPNVHGHLIRAPCLELSWQVSKELINCLCLLWIWRKLPLKLRNAFFCPSAVSRARFRILGAHMMFARSSNCDVSPFANFLEQVVKQLASRTLPKHMPLARVVNTTTQVQCRAFYSNKALGIRISCMK